MHCMRAMFEYKHRSTATVARSSRSHFVEEARKAVLGFQSVHEMLLQHRCNLKFARARDTGRCPESEPHGRCKDSYAADSCTIPRGRFLLIAFLGACSTTDHIDITREIEAIKANPGFEGQVVPPRALVLLLV